MNEITPSGIKYKSDSSGFENLILKSSVVDDVLTRQVAALSSEVEQLEETLAGIKEYLGVS